MMLMLMMMLVMMVMMMTVMIRILMTRFLWMLNSITRRLLEIKHDSHDHNYDTDVNDEDNEYDQ